MNLKALLLSAFLIGCGGPQTPEEERADQILSDFMESCRHVYGSKCEVRLTLHSLVNTEEEQACWTENHSPFRYVTLNKDSVASNNRVSLFTQLLDCSMNLGVLEEETESKETESFMTLIDFLRR